MGFEISVHKGLLEKLVLNQKIALWIHTHVREDLLVLYGFTSDTEKMFFRQLLSVSGLGPKTALSLLSEHGAERLANLIQNKKGAEISEAPGVGKKLAEKIILDLASKIEKWFWLTKLTMNSTGKGEKITPPESNLRNDLSSALSNLGYHTSQIKATLDSMLSDDIEDISFEVGLKRALRELSKVTPRSETHSNA
jgi:Holliday junction DNA helicase RuvA